MALPIVPRAAAVSFHRPGAALCSRALSMYRVYRMSPKGLARVTDVATFDEVKPTIRRAAPGHYIVDEITADAMASEHTARHCGMGVKRRDGSVVLDRWETRNAPQ